MRCCDSSDCWAEFAMWFTFLKKKSQYCARSSEDSQCLPVVHYWVLIAATTLLSVWDYLAYLVHFVISARNFSNIASEVAGTYSRYAIGSSKRSEAVGNTRDADFVGDAKDESSGSPDHQNGSDWEVVGGVVNQRVVAHFLRQSCWIEGCEGTCKGQEQWGARDTCIVI